MHECGSSLFLFAAVGFFWVGVAYLKFSGNLTAAAPSNANKKNNVSSSNNNNAASNAEKLNTAQQFMQTAINQAAQAETAASRASMGNRDTRLAAAYEAQCYADAARNWADQATQRTYGASSPAQDAAAKAREAAYKAQAAADRAKYFASNASS